MILPTPHVDVQEFVKRIDKQLILPTHEIVV
jgi:hypothetical protein